MSTAWPRYFIILSVTSLFFIVNYDSSLTLGVEYGSKVFTVSNNKSVKLQVLDTSGDNIFRPVTESYYKGSAGALVVYDISM